MKRIPHQTGQDITTMNIKEFLTHPDIQLPLRWDGSDFKEFMRNRVKRYHRLRTQLTEAPRAIRKLIEEKRTVTEAFRDAVPEIVEETFLGRPQDAYRRFEEVIPELGNAVGVIRTIPFGEEVPFLFRVRTDIPGTADPADLFHIPFEKRHLVSTQRFSIPGLPCLYLSGSLYTCWCEMKRPPFHTITASAFWSAADQEITVLDISAKPSQLAALLPDDESSLNNEMTKRISAFITVWPLLATCYISVKSPISPYKPEYMFPQLLLQWVTKKVPCDGIQYFSTHVDSNCLSKPHVVCNYVFPSRTSLPSGHCSKLILKFRMSKPYNWQLMSSVPRPIIDYKDFKIDGIVDGYNIKYTDTEFGRIERFLHRVVSRSRKSKDPDAGKLQ